MLVSVGHSPHHPHRGTQPLWANQPPSPPGLVLVCGWIPAPGPIQSGGRWQWCLSPVPPPQAAVEELEGLRTEMRATGESLRRAPELGTADLIPSCPSVVNPPPK